MVYSGCTVKNESSNKPKNRRIWESNVTSQICRLFRQKFFSKMPIFYGIFAEFSAFLLYILPCFRHIQLVFRHTGHTGFSNTPIFRRIWSFFFQWLSLTLTQYAQKLGLHEIRILWLQTFYQNRTAVYNIFPSSRLNPIFGYTVL